MGRVLEVKRNSKQARTREQIMLRLVGCFLIFDNSGPFGSPIRSSSGTITEVKVIRLQEVAPLDAAAMTSVKVRRPMYVVLYTPAGRGQPEVCAGVTAGARGEKTITYNDMLGRSFAVPNSEPHPAANLNSPNQFREPASSHVRFARAYRAGCDRNYAVETETCETTR